jgi:cytochrome c5
MMLKIQANFLVAAITLMSVSCGDELPQPREQNDDHDSADEGSTGSIDAGRADAAKVDASKSDASKPADASMTSDASAAATGLPCEVAKVVGERCASCHGEKPVANNPSFLSVADFQKIGSDDRPLHEIAHEKVNLSGPGRMPPTSAKALSATELKTLSDWLAAGAKSSAPLCPVSTIPTTPDGEFATPGSGGAHTKPIKYEDPDLQCYKFTAFSARDRKAKYSVPTEPDFYVAFNMTAPWKGTQYIRSFRGIIDNADAIHHWLFFRNLLPQTDGSVVEDNLGAHPDGEMLFGWAPGGEDMYLDPDVGFAAAGGETYLLEAHYNNKSGSPVPDSSGVEVCVTPTKPKNVAGLTWIGTDSINGTTATGLCASTHRQPVHIFMAQPHMHVKGRHMKVVVNRAGGAKDVIHDEDFDFEFQRSYMLDVLLQPGDTISTTCSFSSPARFGKGTNDEMCYFFTNAWPAGAITMPGLGTIIHGPNSCL